MDNLSPHLQLRIPNPDKLGLSYCDASPQGLTTWLAGLPKANLGETARLLYQCLAELNQLDTPSSNRMRLMELLRPDVLFVCKHLEKHFLNQSIVLEDRPRKVANLCQALQNHLTIGYKLIVVQDASDFRNNKRQQLAIAMQRSLHSMFGTLVRANQLYCPVPDGLWLEMHLVYRTACSLNLQHLPVADPLSELKQTTHVENAYLAALMIGCAQTNQMRQNAISNLANVIVAWTPLVHLEAAENLNAPFWVPTYEDAPPRLKSLFIDSEKNDLLGLNPAPLLAVIEKYLHSADGNKTQTALLHAERIPVEQIQHLEEAWSQTAERTFRRIPAQGNISICVGMSAVHYFLAGEKSFSEVLINANSAAGNMLEKKNPARNDVWSRSFDAKTTSAIASKEPMEEIQYRNPDGTNFTAGGLAGQEKYPLHQLLVINHSPSGYRLSWPGEVPSQLQAGELLGIQDAQQKSLNIAVVRWIRQVQGGGTQMGVELIAPAAKPCGLQLIRKADQSSQFLRALLLPEIRAISRPPSLITARLPFQEGHKVLISIDGNNTRATLGKRALATGSFSQFEYLGIKALTDVIAESNRSDNPREEDFDSLWKSL